jgi:hypothetical protein
MFPLKFAVFLLLGLGASITLNILQALFGPFPPPTRDDRRIRLLAELDAKRLHREIGTPEPEPETADQKRLEELRRRLG